MAVKLNQVNFETVFSDGRTALIDFYSDGCVPCRKLSPIFAELEEKFGDRLLFGKVNAGCEPELVKRYHISGTPTLVLFKDGKVAETIERVVKKEKLEEIILRYI